ncbi:unnamed protein product, partial [Ilex paraguariensis]
EVLAYVVSSAPATSVALTPIPTSASGIFELSIVPTDPALTDAPKAPVLSEGQADPASIEDPEVPEVPEALANPFTGI